ncbi:MAG: TetR/AcrR family transcriptional regulator [Candidatus Marinimicrobia bacterium]|nr:TetR/AcrR family transcriptional regulator [Candidatus Neomarinimicrobiota bacterium]
MNNNSEKVVLSRKERDKLRNKEAILDAAVHLFAQKGFTQTKLEDVAALAEFGKGTIYNYFENKNDLLMSAFSYALGKVIDYIEAQLASVIDPLDRLRLIVNAQFDYYQSNEDFLRVIVANQQIIGKMIHEKPGQGLHLRFMHLRKLMIREIQTAIDRKLIRAGDATRYASYLSGMIHSQVRSLNNHEINIDEVKSNEIVDIFLNGVSHV